MWLPVGTLGSMLIGSIVFWGLVLFLTRFVSTPCSARSVRTAELGDGIIAMQACDPALKKVDSTNIFLGML